MAARFQIYTLHIPKHIIFCSKTGLSSKWLCRSPMHRSHTLGNNNMTFEIIIISVKHFEYYDNTKLLDVYGFFKKNNYTVSTWKLNLYTYVSNFLFIILFTIMLYFFFFVTWCKKYIIFYIRFNYFLYLFLYIEKLYNYLCLLVIAKLSYSKNILFNGFSF